MFRTPFIVALVNVLLWFIQGQLNDLIAPWSLSFFFGGLAVAFASLRLSPREGARALILTGFWYDAAAPVPFGLHVFFFLLAHAVVCSVRSRIARDETLVGLFVATLVNLGILIALTLALMHRHPDPIHLWPRLVADSLVSFCAVLLLGVWYFPLQEHTLEICGAGLRREQRGVV